jgi:hypothetical protein
MRKHLIIAAAAALLSPAFMPTFAGAALAAPQDHQQGEHPRFSDEDRAAFTDARIAALKAGLKLTPAQEKNWPALESVIREQAKARSARFAEWHEKSKEHEGHHNAIEGLQRRAKALETRSGELVKLSEAAKPLYDSLDEAQKHRFGVLLHAVGGERHGGHWGHEGGHGSHD